MDISKLRNEYKDANIALIFPLRNLELFLICSNMLNH